MFQLICSLSLDELFIVRKEGPLAAFDLKQKTLDKDAGPGPKNAGDNSLPRKPAPKSVLCTPLRRKRELFYSASREFK